MYLDTSFVSAHLPVWLLDAFKSSIWNDPKWIYFQYFFSINQSNVYTLNF